MTGEAVVWLPWEPNGGAGWYRETDDGAEYVIRLDRSLLPTRCWEVFVEHDPDAPPIGVLYVDDPITPAEARRRADEFAARTINPDGGVSER